MNTKYEYDWRKVTKQMILKTTCWIINHAVKNRNSFWWSWWTCCKNVEKIFDQCFQLGIEITKHQNLFWMSIKSFINLTIVHETKIHSFFAKQIFWAIISDTFWLFEHSVWWRTFLMMKLGQTWCPYPDFNVKHLFKVQRMKNPCSSECFLWQTRVLIISIPCLNIYSLKMTTKKMMMKSTWSWKNSMPIWMVFSLV